MIDRNERARTLRHARGKCLLGILDDGDPAGLLDRGEPRSSVIQRTGQHDADHARTIDASRGTEQGIDRRAAAVFRRPTDDPNPPLFNDQVMIRSCDVHPAALEAVAVLRMAGGQRARS